METPYISDLWELVPKYFYETAQIYWNSKNENCRLSSRKGINIPWKVPDWNQEPTILCTYVN